MANKSNPLPPYTNFKRCLLLTISLFLLSQTSVFAQPCLDGSAVIVDISLQDAFVCEGDSANVIADITSASDYQLSEVDSIEWVWYIYFGSGTNPANNIPSYEYSEFTYPPFGTEASNTKVYDDFLEIGNCSQLSGFVGNTSNQISLGIRTIAYVTCPDGQTATHGETVDFFLELLPRPSFQLESNIICQGDQTCIIDNTCFADSILIDLGNGTTTNDLCLSNLPIGTYDIQLIAFNSCTEEGIPSGTQTLQVVPIPNAQIQPPPELQNSIACPDTYCFDNISDTVNHYNTIYFWETIYNGSLQMPRDTHYVKDDFCRTFNAPGTYDIILYAGNPSCQMVSDTFSFEIIQEPFIQFNINPDEGCEGELQTINIDASYITYIDPNNSITTHSWTLNGGTNGIEFPNSPYPGNINLGLGENTIVVNTASTCGPYSETETITIHPVPVAGFDMEISPQDACGIDTIILISTATSASEIYWYSYPINIIPVNQQGADTAYIIAPPYGDYTFAMEVSNEYCTAADTASIVQSVYGSPYIIDIGLESSYCDVTVIDLPAIQYDSSGCPLNSLPYWEFTNGVPESFYGYDPPPVTFPYGEQSISVTLGNCCIDTTQTFSFLLSNSQTGAEIVADTIRLCEGNCIGVETNIAGGNLLVSGLLQSDSILCHSDFSSAGIYLLEYQYGNSECLDIDTAYLDIVESVDLEILQTVTSFCEDAPSVILTGNFSGEWAGAGITDASTGEFDPSQVAVDSSFWIYLTFTDSNTACTYKDSIDLYVASLPVAELALDSLSFCKKDTIIFLENYLGISDPGGFNTWDGEGIVDENSGGFNPAVVSGNMTTLDYVVSDILGCDDTTQMIIELLEIVPATGQYWQDSVCVSQDTMHFVGHPYSGTWNSQNSSFSITEDSIVSIPSNIPTGEYEFIYWVNTETLGCASSDTISVHITNPNLDLDMGSDLVYCITDEVAIPQPVNLSGTPLWNVNGGLNDGCLNNTQTGEVDLYCLGPGIHEMGITLGLNISDAICSVTGSINLYVDTLPTGGITADSTACIGEMVDFSFNAYQETDTWTWSLSDGTVLSNDTPVIQHSFESTGSHIIYVSSTLGECEHLDSFTIQISGPPPVPSMEMILSSQDSCETLNVTFTNISEVDSDVLNVSYSLDYGNGETYSTTSISEAFPSMDYSAGVYIITLYSFSDCDPVAGLWTDTLVVNPMPQSSIGPQYEINCSGNPTVYTISSTGNPTTIIMHVEHPDGVDTIVDYSNNIFTYTYYVNELDTFQIMLVSINPCGSDTTTTQVIIEPTEVDPGFTVEGNGNLCASIPFCFSSNGTIGAITWYEMGDGNIVSGTDSCHIYTEPGIYTITQHVLDECDGEAIFQTQVEVYPLPTPSITHELIVCWGDTVHFEGSIDTGNSFSWDFGDGDTSGMLSSLHVYDSAGTFLVSFYEENIYGCVGVAEGMVTVLPIDTPTFMATDSVCVGDVVELVNTTSGSIESCLWTISDGTVLSGCESTHVFTEEGVYNITLEVTYSDGCESILTSTVFVRPTPVANFDYDIVDVCGSYKVQFYNNSIGYNTVFWELGNGNVSDSLGDLLYEYQNSGVYTVWLFISYDGICFDSISQQINIQQIPQAQINLMQSEGCEPLSTIATSESISDNPLGIEWLVLGGITPITSYEDTLYVNNLIHDPVSTYQIHLMIEDLVTGCRDTHIVDMVVFDHPEVTIQIIENIDCFGNNNGSLVANVNGGMPSYQISWSNQTLGEINEGLVAGNYSVTVTDANGCMAVASINLPEPPPLEIGLVDKGDATCIGINDAFIEVIASGGYMPSGADYQYVWSDINLTQSNVLEDVGTGTYTVTVTDFNGCTQSASYTIEDGYSMSVIDTVENILCYGDANGRIIIQEINGGIAPFTLTLVGEINQTEYADYSVVRFDSLSAGYYHLTIEDVNGCLFEKDYEVGDWSPLSVTATANPSTIILGNSTELGVIVSGSGLSYQWSPSSTLDCDTCENPIATPPNADSVIYNIIVTDEHGCTATDNVIVRVERNKNVYIPNVFTPNEDGFNDEFFPHGNDLVKRVIRMRIFDRWGDLVFMNSDFPIGVMTYGWDGRLGNREMNNAVFVYIIEVEYLDGKVEIFKGDVTMLR